MKLTEIEKLRYERQMMIKGWGEDGQRKLKQAKVFVAGAGGLGSSLLYYLTAAGIGTIRVCDFDRVELSNLNRQILHYAERIGMNKAESAKRTLQNINEHVHIEIVKEKIQKNNAKRLIGDSALIIDCLDNFDTRHVLNRIAVEMNKPYVHAGIEGFRGQVTFIHHPQTACLACFIPLKVKKVKFPVVGTTPGIMGTLQAMETIKYITGIGELLKNRLLVFDGLAMEFSFIKLTKNSRCPVCSKSFTL
ncbi:MAG: HesA/MoeB/ThiF family protein [Spirochaetes bacterium]|nr:HesA/MoeB/ThiF family protein [Spirochaetota bacterium]